LSKRPKRRWVPAPDDTDQAANNAVTGVFLDINERVEWVYSSMPDGKRVVTGYDILPVLSLEQKEDFQQLLSS